MSMLPLLRGLQAFLLDSDTGLNLTKNHCRISPKGHPIAMAAQNFIGLWPFYWRNNDEVGQYRHDDCGVNVTITRRIATPMDRVDVELEELLELTDLVVSKVHMDPDNDPAYGVRYAANTILTASKPPFITPLRFNSVSVPEEKGGDWFYASQEKHAGLAVTISFDKAERPMSIETQQG